LYRRSLCLSCSSSSGACGTEHNAGAR
jgi:hypothetical protein